MIVLRKDGRILTQAPLPEMTLEAPREDGAYRIEVYLPTAPAIHRYPGSSAIPFISGRSDGESAMPVTPPLMADRSVIQGGPWHVEKDAGSASAFTHADPPSGPLEFRYRLGTGERLGQ